MTDGTCAVHVYAQCTIFNIIFCYYLANWLNIHKSLREQGIDETGVLILRKGLYVTDDNVDVNDPIQVNLIFVQVSYNVHVHVLMMMQLYLVLCKIHVQAGLLEIRKFCCILTVIIML